LQAIHVQWPAWEPPRFATLFRFYRRTWPLPGSFGLNDLVLVE
jgi:hypothetical protein